MESYLILEVLLNILHRFIEISENIWRYLKEILGDILA